MSSGIFYPAVNGDDGFWFGATWYVPASSIDIGKEGADSASAFIRFPNVGIPQGSIISACFLRLYAAGATSGTVCNVKIYCEDSNDASAPTDVVSGNALVLTTANYAWSSIPAWGPDLTSLDSPDISAVLQEVIDRPGFISGNAVQIVIKDNVSDSSALRSFCAFDLASGNYKAELHVTWTVVASPRTINTPVTLPILRSYGLLEWPSPRVLSSPLSLPILEMDGFLDWPSPREITAIATFPILTIASTMTNVFSEHGTADVTMGAITAQGYGGGNGNITLSPLTLSATGSTGFVASFDQPIPRITLAGLAYQETIGNLNAFIPAITIGSQGIHSFSGTLDASIPKISITASALAGFLGTLNKSIHPITLTGNSYWMGTNSLDTSIPAITLNALAKAAAADIIGLSLNTKNFGLTRYADFAYNSLCIFNGNLVGAKSDGIYEVTDSHENENPITWNIRTGKLDLLKNYLRYAWITGTITGDIKMVVEDGEGNRYEYIGEPVSLNSHELRIKVGKGLKSRYVTLEFYNESDEQVIIDKLRVFGKPGARKR